MAWVHDSGYGPVYDHTGYPVTVLLDGSEIGSRSGVDTEDVIGWRSGCECGWRGAQFYPRSEWPGSSSIAPEGVDGWETGTAAFAEWTRHIFRALPLLDVRDLAEVLVDAETRLRDAVRAARHAGYSWSAIGAASRTDAREARQRWGTPTERPHPGAADGRAKSADRRFPEAGPSQ